MLSPDVFDAVFPFLDRKLEAQGYIIQSKPLSRTRSTKRPKGGKPDLNRV